MDQEQKLLSAAEQFRRAIESSLDVLPLELRSFPRGQCGIVTRLLGAYFEDLGLGSFDYVTGGRIDPDEPDEEPFSHAWLEKDGLIIDITADQFPDMPGGPL